MTISYYLIEIFQFISGLILLFILNSLVSKQIKIQGVEIEESESDYSYDENNSMSTFDAKSIEIGRPNSYQNSGHFS